MQPIRWIVVGLAVVVALSGCRRSESASGASEDPAVDEPLTAAEIETVETLSPLPEVPRDPTNAVSGEDDAAHFGRFLFYEERLSADGDVSCASCHRPDHGFSVPTRVGEGNEETLRHPPSLLNVAYHKWYDWDGKADSLWAQAMRPLESPSEHGFSRTRIVHLFDEDSDLAEAYRSVFGPLPEVDAEKFPPKARPTPDSPESSAHRAWTSMTESERDTVNRIASNTTKAIAAYQERLVSGEAPFDQYVEGLREGDREKLDALSPAAKRGLSLFVGEAECVNCHNGPNLTDSAFHNLGLESRAWLPEGDEGRWEGVSAVTDHPFNATGTYSDAPDGEAAAWIEYLTRTPEDHGQFKTPTLRNVEVTPPYMHGGHFETLEEVVRFYSTLDERPQVGHREDMLDPLGLSDREVDDLVAFLTSLTGREVPEALRSPPDSPVP